VTLVEANKVRTEFYDITVLQCDRCLNDGAIHPRSQPGVIIFHNVAAAALPRNADMLRIEILVHGAEKRERHMVATTKKRNRTAQNQLASCTVTIDHREPRLLQYHLHQTDQRADAYSQNDKGRSTTRHARARLNHLQHRIE
jgi:hypothetical protein